MVRGAVLVGVIGACGRVGYDPVAASGKPDAPTVPDGDPSLDAPVGVGSYTITETTAPYAGLDGANPAPGFMPGDDDGLYMLPLPFPFRFYGIDYTELAISSNGYVAFGAPAPSPETYENDCPLDASAPDAMIAVFWDDLFASKEIMPFGTIVVASDAAQVAVEWRDVDAYYHAGGGNNFFSQNIRTTQKVVLHANGVIDLHYGPRTGSAVVKDCGTDRHVGCSATVGLRAPSSSTLQMVQCGTELGFASGATPIVEGRKITFTPR